MDTNVIKWVETNEVDRNRMKNSRKREKLDVTEIKELMGVSRNTLRKQKGRWR